MYRQHNSLAINEKKKKHISLKNKIDTNDYTTMPQQTT